MKIAVVQHESCGRTIGERVEEALSFMEEANKLSSDIILFPECFLSLYENPEGRDDAIVSEKWIDIISNKAESLSLGTLITCFTPGPRNSAFLIDKTGKVLFRYDKVHTCAFDWERTLITGNRFFVSKIGSINIGVMICYDREYPESARCLSLMGAELILVPNNSSDMSPRLIELFAESMQNMAAIAMANVPGKGKGFSCFITPYAWDGGYDGNVQTLEEDYDGLALFTLDEEKLFRYRRTEDLGKYRHIDAYKPLVE